MASLEYAQLQNELAMARYEESMKAKNHLPFQMGYLTEEMVKRAEKELGETEGTKAKAIPALREKIEEEPNLVCPTDDAYLLQYLRARKYDVKKAFKLMQNYHQVKKQNSDIYDTCDPDLLRKCFATKCLYCLPYRDLEGCVIYVLRLNNWNPDEIPVAEGITALTIALLRCLEDPATGVCGIQILVDVKGVSWKQIKCVNQRFLSLFSKALRNTLACRFKGIHIFNESVIFQYLWSIFKFFLSEKINKRVHFHGDSLKQLHKFIPKCILPQEYGGDYPQDVNDWYNPEIEKYFERYAELTTYGYKD